MNKAVFMKKFGGVFEHSPWVADAVFSTQTKASMGNSDALSDGFKQVFLESAREPQLETLRAHPQLVCGLAEPAELTVDSVSEQLGSGLDECTPAEFAEFGRLNTAYMEKFGFPFIIAVRGRDRQGILRMFRLRLQNDAVLEYQSALLQVCQIARLRIGDILSA